MTDYTAKDYARLAHWQTQKPHAQQNPELIDALLYAKELASARGTTEACEARRQAARGGGTVVEKTRETSPIDYTERDVRKAANTFGSGDIYKMLTQLADMLAERDMAHDLIKTGDTDAHPAICDANGDVVLAYCRRCHQGEGDLQDKCPAAKPRVDADAVIAYLSKFSGFDGWWGPIDDETSDEIMDGLQRLLAAQESGR